MKEKLTPKQEKFCLVYVELGNASEAYRQAYNSRKMKPATINKKSYELLQNGQITARIEQFQAEARERHEETVDDLVRELNEALQAARDVQNPMAMCKAIMDKAKLLGFLTTKQEHRITGGVDGQITLAELLAGGLDDDTVMLS